MEQFLTTVSSYSTQSFFVSILFGIITLVTMGIAVFLAHKDHNISGAILALLGWLTALISKISFWVGVTLLIIRIFLHIT